MTNAYLLFDMREKENSSSDSMKNCMTERM